MQSRNGITNGAALLAIGGLIGAGAALLLAPQSGKQTRRDIVHFGKVARNKSDKVLLDVRRRAGKMVSRLSDRLQDQVYRGQQLAEGAKNAIEFSKARLLRKGA